MYVNEFVFYRTSPGSIVTISGTKRLLLKPLRKSQAFFLHLKIFFYKKNVPWKRVLLTPLPLRLFENINMIFSTRSEYFIYIFKLKDYDIQITIRVGHMIY